jgi:hypothetical protein
MTEGYVEPAALPFDLQEADRAGVTNWPMIWLSTTE